jgi:acetolactate synthase-1/3 small subunit
VSIAIATPGVPAGVHTISLFVHNRPGVLVRVALIFARRGYNIESLVASSVPNRPEFSRMTITCSGDPAELEQIIKQCSKLVDVVNAIDHTGHRAIDCEIMLVKLACALDRRTEILQAAEHYQAQVVDFGPESLILQAFGESEKLDLLQELLSKFTVLEQVRSGRILMARGAQQT